jgi:hypothetical protein
MAFFAAFVLVLVGIQAASASITASAASIAEKRAALLVQLAALDNEPIEAATETPRTGTETQSQNRFQKTATHTDQRPTMTHSLQERRRRLAALKDAAVATTTTGTAGAEAVLVGGPLAEVPTAIASADVSKEIGGGLGARRRRLSQARKEAEAEAEAEAKVRADIQTPAAAISAAHAHAQAQANTVSMTAEVEVVRVSPVPISKTATLAERRQRLAAAKEAPAGMVTAPAKPMARAAMIDGSLVEKKRGGQALQVVVAPAPVSTTVTTTTTAATTTVTTTTTTTAAPPPHSDSLSSAAEMPLADLGRAGDAGSSRPDLDMRGEWHLFQIAAAAVAGLVSAFGAGVFHSKTRHEEPRMSVLGFGFSSGTPTSSTAGTATSFIPFSTTNVRRRRCSSAFSVAF